MDDQGYSPLPATFSETAVIALHVVIIPGKWPAYLIGEGHCSANDSVIKMTYVAILMEKETLPMDDENEGHIAKGRINRDIRNCDSSLLVNNHHYLQGLC